MSAPFRVGDPAVWISNDDAGMRLTRVAVFAVRPDGDGWSVETSGGSERVDASGEGSQLVPLDPELAAAFEERGPSFVVRSTVDAALDRDVDMFTQFDWRRLEPDLGPDRGPEHGPEH